METELKTMESPDQEIYSSSLRLLIREPDFDDPKYTSLRDIIISSKYYSSSSPLLTARRSSWDGNIAIRNQLVKRAASAYVQSTAILASRREHWMVSVWRKLRYKLGLRWYYWYVYVWDPIQACFGPIRRVLARVVH